MVARNRDIKRPLQPLLPPKTATYQEKSGRDRWIQNPTAVKWLWRGRSILREFWRGLIGPVLNADALFRLLCVPFFLFFVFLFTGGQGVINESIIITAGVLALIATLPVWALLNLLVAPFRRILAERAEGYWQGSRFIYHERKHLFTFEWCEANNGGGVAFRVRGIPKDALIDYVIEVDGPADLIRCMLVGRFYFYPVVPVLELWKPALRGSVRLRRGRVLHLYCYSTASARPIIVRVYAVAWNIQPTALMYYTDKRLNVSVEVTNGQKPQIETKPPKEERSDG